MDTGSKVVPLSTTSSTWMTKLYAKDEQDINSLIHLTRVFRSDIGMTFGLAKCGCLIVNRGKVKSTCGISLPEGQIDDIDKSYKYLETKRFKRNRHRNKEARDYAWWVPFQVKHN